MYAQNMQPGIMIAGPGGALPPPGPYPQRIQCPHCNQMVVTDVEPETGLITYLACFGIFLCCPFGCCFIPFCVDTMKNVTHKCPNCGSFIHQYKRIPCGCCFIPFCVDSMRDVSHNCPQCGNFIHRYKRM